MSLKGKIGIIHMKRSLYVVAMIVFSGQVAAEAVDMTGLSCHRTTALGTWTWEFYGDVAMRYHQDGSRSRLPRLGRGAYEKYGPDGEWTAIYYFFDLGDGIQVRILARPGSIVREDNPRAPLISGVFSLNGSCVSLG